MGRKFAPSVTIRVTDNRTKAVSEFSHSLPIEGHLADIFPVFKKLRAVFELHGIMPSSKPKEKTDGQEEKGSEEIPGEDPREETDLGP